MSRLVLWSGGLDSTLLLSDLATTHPQDMVNAITVKAHTNTTAQATCERKARKVLKKKLWNKNITYHEISIDNDFTNESNQMPIWLVNAIMCMRDGDELNMGYLSSDGADFWDRKVKLLNVFDAFVKFRGLKDATIRFPLQYLTKGDVITNLKKKKLLKYCWCCGQPNKGKPCGKCMKCISLKRWKKYPEHGIDT